MRNKMKRIIAVLLMGTMLFGGVLTAQASSSHAHKYYEDKKVNSIRSASTTHQYVDSKGVTRTCTVTTYLNTYNKVCSCGYVLSSYTATEVLHSEHSHNN